MGLGPLEGLGIRHTRKHNREEFACNASERLSKVVEPNDQDVKAEVAQYGYRVVEIEAESRRISLLLNGFLALLVAGVCGLPFLLLAPPGKGVAQSLALSAMTPRDLLVIYGVVTVSGLIGLSPYFFASSSRPSRSGFPVFSRFTALGCAAAGVMLRHTHPLLAIGLVQACIGLTAGLLLRASFGSLIRRLRRDQEARFPDVLLLRELAGVWHDLHAPGAWLSIDARAGYAARLQYLEKLVSANFWRVLAPGDRRRREWARERAHVIARLLRELDGKVAWPASGTREQVADEIQRICRCVVEAKLMDLHTSAPPESRERLPVATMMAHGLVAVLPLAGLVVCKRAAISLPEKVEPYVSLGAYLWAVAVLLGIFPVVEKHLPVVRAAVQFFKGKGD